MPRLTRTSIVLTALAGGIFWSLPIGNDYDSAVSGNDRSRGFEPTRFEASLHRKVLHLAGHSASSEHEQQLKQVAHSQFAHFETNIDLTQLKSLPDRWTKTTELLLLALSATQSASALLTDQKLRVRGVANKDWHDRLKTLRSALPETVRLDIDVLVPDASKSVADLCARAFAAQRPGPINFEESATALRYSAYPVLERIISLANECRDSTVHITGHTDSSGDESWNRHLSLLRAKAVADQIALRGISRHRIFAVGAGSSSPIADNYTRYGRGINRRIEITLRQAGAEEES